MARYVNLNDILETIVEHWGYYGVEEDLNKLPAADVAEVKHGEWIYHECVSTHDGTTSGYSCSECRAFVDEEIFDMDEFNKEFCGNCGAKMDGKGDSE